MCYDVPLGIHRLQPASAFPPRTDKNIVVACNFPDGTDLKELLEPKKECKLLDIWIPEHVPMETWADFIRAPVAELR